MTPIEAINEEIRRMEWFEAAIAEIEATGELSIPPAPLYPYPVDLISDHLQQ